MDANILEKIFINLEDSLRNLDLIQLNCHESAFEKVAPHLKNVEELGLMLSSNFNDHSLKLINENCSKLEFLNFTGLFNISDRGIENLFTHDKNSSFMKVQDDDADDADDEIESQEEESRQIVNQGGIQNNNGNNNMMANNETHDVHDETLNLDPSNNIHSSSSNSSSGSNENVNSSTLTSSYSGNNNTSNYENDNENNRAATSTNTFMDNNHTAIELLNTNISNTNMNNTNVNSNILETNTRNINLHGISSSTDYSIHRRMNKKIIKNNKLRRISLSDCTDISDEALGIIATKCKCIEALSIDDCPRITDDGFINFIKLQPSLKYLSLANSETISSQALEQMNKYCKKIEKINIKGCLKISENSMKKFIEFHPDLNTLCIDNEKNTFSASYIQYINDTFLNEDFDDLFLKWNQ